MFRSTSWRTRTRLSCFGVSGAALMRLDTLEITNFTNQGLLLPNWQLKRSYVAVLVEQLSVHSCASNPLAFEPDGRTLRAIHGCHTRSAIFHRLTRLNAILCPARQIVKDQVYVYQFKINLKSAFAGDLWPWHQDYSFWAKEDGMPAPLAITAAIFLDDVTEFNGPIFFIPGSHRNGLYDVHANTSDNDWRKHVAADLSYQTDQEKIIQLVEQHGMIAPKGPRGTILFFHSNIVHASPANISPMQRRILFITYNSINNLPRNTKRPAFLVSRDTRPLEPLDDGDSEVVEMIENSRYSQRV